MSKNLVIVESPAKAKTIEKYLGADFTVKSSVGHIRDLVKKGLGVDTTSFEPEYAVSEDKKAIVKELKSLAKKAEVVWLATDEDREGEAISWHLLEALGLKEEKTKRIVYNEITKEAIVAAIQKPRKINRDLVDAQQARRILDRLVGFELSPILWRKVKPSLSAGRVQSVTVRMIVERERQIQAFVSESSYKVTAHFDIKGKTILKAELAKNLATKKEAEAFLKSCSEAIFSIIKLEKKPAKRSSAAPFTTSTLQQEAGRKFGYAVGQTMSIAQRLYEEGLITYMRTDSVNLSDFAMNAISTQIKTVFGDQYLSAKNYKSNSKGAQEAHEAIRPTDISNLGENINPQHQKLYELIWKRTIASQMADAEFERTTVKIGVSNSDKELVARGEIVKFDGFLKVYVESTDDEVKEDGNTLLPDLSVGEQLILTNMDARERFTQHPPRYTESSLVKSLEEKGIGRPSTYAPTISTVLKRNYVVKEDRDGKERTYQSMTLENGVFNAFEGVEITGAEKSKLFPTDIGILVNDFLVTYFSSIVDYDFTAKIEKEFDEIAEGQKEWKAMLKSFYQPFHQNVEETLENSERVTGERILGVDPKTGKQISTRMGKFGPLVQLGESDPDNEDAEKPRFASLRKGQSIGDITLEDALELFKLPKVVGEYDGKPLKVAIGRFGPYIQSGSLFASIPKGEDPLEIELDRAIELVEQKKKADIDKFINVFEHEKGEIQILNGRFGPYIKLGKNNFKIPKGEDPKSITLEKALDLIENPIKPKRGKK